MRTVMSRELVLEGCSVVARIHNQCRQQSRPISHRQVQVGCYYSLRYPPQHVLGSPEGSAQGTPQARIFPENERYEPYGSMSTTTPMPSTWLRPLGVAAYRGSTSRRWSRSGRKQVETGIVHNEKLGHSRFEMLESAQPAPAPSKRSNAPNMQCANRTNTFRRQKAAKRDWLASE